MIYLAATLFNDIELERNLRLREELQHVGEVYLPQVDGGMVDEFIQEGMEIRNAIRLVFENDIKAMHQSNMLVAVLDGPHVDSGVAFELGYFFALAKPAVGYRTDIRTELPFGLNPMVSSSLTCLCSCIEDLRNAISEIAATSTGGRAPGKVYPNVPSS